MKNNKGFTLVEMLGVVVILGIISVIAIVGTNKYLKQSREKAYNRLSQSAYEACQNCQIQGKCSEGDITLEQLVDDGYLKDLKNPIVSKNDCSGKITLTSNHVYSNEYRTYKYTVQLNCPGLKQATIIWPK